MIRELTRKSFLPILAGLSLVASSGGLSAEVGYCCEEDDCCFNFTVGAEFLYWDAYQRNHDFASRSELDEPFENIHTRFFNYDWKPGFRVGVSTENLMCDWDFYFGYTWIRHRDTKAVHANEEGEIVISNLPTINGPFCDASGTRSVRTQLWDILFSHRFEFCGCHFLSPYFGVQVAFIDQHLSGEFDSCGSSPPSVDLIWSSKYTGAGLKAGLSYEYQWDDCWDFYARASATLFAGKSRFHLKEVSYIFDNENILDGDRIQGAQGNFVPSSHITFGTHYRTCVCDTPIVINVAWEFLHFYNLPKYPRAFDSREDAFDSNNLGYHGLTIGLGLEF